MKFSQYLLLCWLACFSAAGQKLSVTLEGRVTDAVDGEPVIGASIYFPILKQGTATDLDGCYHLSGLPAVRTTVQVSYVGHQTIIQTVDLRDVVAQGQGEARRMDFTLREDNATLGEVVVTGLTGSALLRDQPAPVSAITPRALLETGAINIIDAIAHQPGVSQITTGTGISKPVIRGLGYNRIVTVADGIRQEGQQWGDEHGIEVDGAGVHSVEILKGPASLMYGSDALAGVLVLHDAPVLPSGQRAATVQTEYQTNSGLWNYSLDVAGNRRFVWDVRYSQKAAHAYHNRRDGDVYGSQLAEQAASVMAGVNRRWGYSHLKATYYHLTPGLVEGERDAATGELLGSKGHSYARTAPYQQIHHYKGVWDNSLLIGDGSLHATLGFQQNRRQEYEEAGECGLDFRLNTVNYDLHYQSPDRAGWRWAAGAGGMWQQSDNLGEEYLVPAYGLFDVGVFASTTWQVGSVTLSGGVRYDRRHLHSHALREEDEATGLPVERFADFRRNLHGLTGSAGASWHPSARTTLRANVSRGFRAPNVSELGSNGEHEGTFRYEVGNSALRAERSWQGDLGWDFSSDILSAQVALFASHISDYIFLQAVPGGTTYAYTSGTARLWGGEASVDVHPVEALHFENTFSLVATRLLHQPRPARYLPMTPAPRWTSDLRYDIVRDGHALNNTFLSVGLECYLRQDRVYEAGGTETPTPGYALLSLHAGTDVRHRGTRVLTLLLGIENLTDRVYQHHLSRLKYAPVNPLTGRQGVSGMGRNVTVKAVIPLFLYF